MRQLCVALLSVGLFACAAPEPLAPAAVRVESVHAAPPRPAWDPTAPPPIHLLVDLTQSMQERGSAGVTHLQAARHAAVRFLRALPADAEVTLHALGTVSSSECRVAVPVEAPANASPGLALARIAASLPSRSEGSFAASLESIARLLRAEPGGGTGAKVVAIGDLYDSCQQANLCEAAEAVVSAGADLDLVVIGGVPVPACIAEIGGDQEPPLVTATAPPPRSFHVSREAERSEASEALVGRVGGQALEVAPGRVRVRVDLDPPLEVGPVDLAPGALLRIRVLEVPGSAPLYREVFVDGEGVGTGETLP
jgi:hypothetical protein